MSTAASGVGQHSELTEYFMLIDIVQHNNGHYYTDWTYTYTNNHTHTHTHIPTYLHAYTHIYTVKTLYIDQPRDQ